MSLGFDFREFDIYYGIFLTYLSFYLVDQISFSYRCCLRFCFMEILERELQNAKDLHNTHRMRPVRNQECPSGRPDLIYNLPEAYSE